MSKILKDLEEATALMKLQGPPRKMTPQVCTSEHLHTHCMKMHESEDYEHLSCSQTHHRSISQSLHKSRSLTLSLTLSVALYHCADSHQECVSFHGCILYWYELFLIIKINSTIIGDLSGSSIRSAGLGCADETVHWSTRAERIYDLVATSCCDH